MRNTLVHVGVQIPDPWAIIDHELQVTYHPLSQHVIREIQGHDLVVRSAQQVHEEPRCQITQVVVRQVQLPHGRALLQAGNEGFYELVS
jgi:hypothetical protein